MKISAILPSRLLDRFRRESLLPADSLGFTKRLGKSRIKLPLGPRSRIVPLELHFKRRPGVRNRLLGLAPLIVLALSAARSEAVIQVRFETWSLGSGAIAHDVVAPHDTVSFVGVS